MAGSGCERGRVRSEGWTLNSTHCSAGLARLTGLPGYSHIASPGAKPSPGRCDHCRSGEPDPGDSLLPGQLGQLGQVVRRAAELTCRVVTGLVILAGFGCDAPPGLGGEALPAMLFVGWLLACVLRPSRQVKTYRECTFSESRTISDAHADSASHPRVMTSAPGLGDECDARAAHRSNARSSADHKPNELGLRHTIELVFSHISAPNGSANRV